MVKHIVLFQLRDNLEPDERQKAMDSFRKGILALPDQIPFIKHIELEYCINPEEKYDVALYSEFDSLDDVKAYAVHPCHVAVASAFIPFVQSRACTDYEI